MPTTGPSRRYHPKPAASRGRDIGLLGHIRGAVIKEHKHHFTGGKVKFCEVHNRKFGCRKLHSGLRTAPVLRTHPSSNAVSSDPVSLPTLPSQDKQAEAKLDRDEIIASSGDEPSASQSRHHSAAARINSSARMERVTSVKNLQIVSRCWRARVFWTYTIENDYYRNLCRS